MSIHSSIKIYASPNAVWSIWENVDQWNVWDPDVQWSQLDGEFCQGTTGTLKPKRGPVTPFIISHCVPFESFTTQSSLPLCRLIFKHSITHDVHFVTVTHSVEFFPTPIFWPLSNYRFDGIPWSNIYVFTTNIILIFLIFFYRRINKKNHRHIFFF